MSYPILLYDGHCGFCNSTVQWILRHERQHTLRFAALQSSYGKAVALRHPELAGVDSFVFLAPSERLFIRSAAVLQVLNYLGGFYNLAIAGYVLPRPVRDFLYDQFAKRRYQWFGKLESCLLPSPEVRARFLDLDDS